MEKPIRIIPYSYSSLSSFEGCGLKHYEERLSKRFAVPFNKAASDGTDMHKEAEEYINNGTPMTNPFAARIKRVVDQLRADGWELYAEVELAVRADRSECGYWDEDCYARDKVDVLGIKGTEAIVLDWKTGKVNSYTDQLKHNAMLVFAIWPEVKTVHTRYEWLKHPKPTEARVHREFFDADWAQYEKRVAKYKMAFENNLWTAKPSGLCQGYCGVKICEHNKDYGKSA